MGISGRDAAARPDPAAADLRGGAAGVRGSCSRSGSCSTTAPAAQPGPAVPRLRAVVRELPGARARRRAPGTSAAAARSRNAPPGRRRGERVHLGPAGARRRRTSPATPPPADGLWTATPALPLAAAPGGHRGLLRDRAARRRHDRVGAGAVKRLGPLLEAERRPAGDVTEVRPDGKETFVQGGWLRGERAQARPPRRARRWRRSSACASATSRRCRATASCQVTIPLYYQGHAYRAGLADPRHDLGAERRPADLGVRETKPKGYGRGGDRLRRSGSPRG